MENAINIHLHISSIHNLSDLVMTQTVAAFKESRMRRNSSAQYLLRCKRLNIEEEWHCSG